MRIDLGLECHARVIQTCWLTAARSKVVPAPFFPTLRQFISILVSSPAARLGGPAPGPEESLAGLSSAPKLAPATTDTVVQSLAGDNDPFAEGSKASEVAKLTDAVTDLVTPRDGNTFGSSAVYLNGERADVRTEETNLGNLIEVAEVGEFDGRSDNKGPEPEAVDIGEIDGQIYAFVGLERVGGVMVYNITDPENASFVQYINPIADDQAPEIIEFVSASDSPNGTPLLLVANEFSGTTTDGGELVDNEPDLDNPTIVVADIEASNGTVQVLDRVLLPLDSPGNGLFTLQLLHASDLKGGADSDLFLFAGGNDTIRDFETGEDLLDLTADSDTLTVDSFLAQTSQDGKDLVFADAATRQHQGRSSGTALFRAFFFGPFSWRPWHGGRLWAASRVAQAVRRTTGVCTATDRRFWHRMTCTWPVKPGRTRPGYAQFVTGRVRQACRQACTGQ